MRASSAARFVSVILAFALGACATCDDLARREQDVVRSAASCSVDADCRIVSADGCHLLCSVAIATSADAMAVSRELQDVRADAISIGCACPVADCVPIADLDAACVEGVCQIR